MQSDPHHPEGAPDGAVGWPGGVYVPEALVRAVCRLLGGRITAPAGCPVPLDRLFRKVAHRRAWYRDRAGKDHQWRELARELGVGKSKRRLDYRALQNAYAESLRAIEAATIDAAYPRLKTMPGSAAPPNVEVGPDGKSFTCAACGDPGEVVVCDWYRCPTVYHPGCLRAGSESCKLLEEGDSAHAWYCPVCLKSCTFLLQPGHSSPEMHATVASFAQEKGLSIDRRALMGKSGRRGRPKKGSAPPGPPPAQTPPQHHCNGTGTDQQHRSADDGPPGGGASGPDNTDPPPILRRPTETARGPGALPTAYASVEEAPTSSRRGNAALGADAAATPPVSEPLPRQADHAGGAGSGGRPAEGGGVRGGVVPPPVSMAGLPAVEGGGAAVPESTSGSESDSESESESESAPMPGPAAEQYRAALEARRGVLVQRLRAACATGEDAASVERARRRGKESRGAVVRALRRVKRDMLDRARLPNTTTKPAGTVTVDDGLKRALDAGTVCTPASVARRTLRGLIVGFDTRENRLRARRSNRSGVTLPLLDGVDPRITARRLLTALLTDALVPAFFQPPDTGAHAARKWLFSDNSHTTLGPALCEAPMAAVDACFTLAATIAAGGAVADEEVKGGGDGPPLTGALCGAVLATRVRVRACKDAGARARSTRRARAASTPQLPLETPELPQLPELPARGGAAPSGEGERGEEGGGAAQDASAPTPAGPPSACATPPETWRDHPRLLQPSESTRRSASLFVRWSLSDVGSAPPPVGEGPVQQHQQQQQQAQPDDSSDGGAGASLYDDGIGLRTWEFTYHAARGRQQLMERVKALESELESEARAAAMGTAGTPSGRFFLCSSGGGGRSNQSTSRSEAELVARWARQQAAAHTGPSQAQHWIGLWLRVAAHDGLLRALHDASTSAGARGTTEKGGVPSAGAGNGEGEGEGEEEEAAGGAEAPVSAHPGTVQLTSSAKQGQDAAMNAARDSSAPVPDSAASRAGTAEAPPDKAGGAEVGGRYKRALANTFSPWMIGVLQPVATRIAIDVLEGKGHRRVESQAPRSSRPQSHRSLAHRAAVMAAVGAFDQEASDRPRSARGGRQGAAEVRSEITGGAKRREGPSSAQGPSTAPGAAASASGGTRKRGRPPGRPRPSSSLPSSSPGGRGPPLRVSALDRASFVPRDTPSSVLSLPTAVLRGGARVRLRLRLRGHTYEPEARSRLGLPRLSETLEELEPVARPRQPALDAAELVPVVTPIRGSVSWPWRSLGGRNRQWPAFLRDLAPPQPGQEVDERGATVIVAALLSISSAGPAVMRSALGVDRVGHQTGESPPLDPKLLAEAVERPELLRSILRSVGDAEQRGADGGAVTAADSSSRVLQMLHALPRVLPQAVAYLSQAAGTTAPPAAASDYSAAQRWMQGFQDKPRQRVSAAALLSLLSDVVDRAGANAASRAVAELGSSDPRVQSLAAAANRHRDHSGMRTPFHQRAVPLPPRPLADVDGLHRAQLASALGPQLGPTLTVALGPGLLSEVLLVAQSGLHASEPQPSMAQRLLTLQEAVALRALLTASAPAPALDAIRARARRILHTNVHARHLVDNALKRDPSPAPAQLASVLARDAQRETLALLRAILAALGLCGRAATLALQGKGGAGLGSGLGAVPCSPDELPLLPPEACRPASRALAAEMRRHNPIWSELCSHLRRIQSRLPAYLEEEQRTNSLTQCMGTTAANAATAAADAGSSGGAVTGAGETASSAGAGASRRRPVIITESVDLFVVWPPELVYGSCLEYKPHVTAQGRSGTGGSSDLPLRQQLERDTLQDSVKPAARRATAARDAGTPPLVWTSEGLRDSARVRRSEARARELPSLDAHTPCVAASELFQEWSPDRGAAQPRGACFPGKPSLGGVPDPWLAMHPESSVRETLPQPLLSYIVTRRVRRHRAMVLGQWQESLETARSDGPQRTVQELAQALGARSPQELRTMPHDVVQAAYQTARDVLEPGLPLPLPLRGATSAQGDPVGDALADFFPIAAVFDAFPLAFSVPAGTAADSEEFAQARERALARAKQNVFRAFVRSREILRDQPVLWRTSRCAACDMGWAHVCTRGGEQSYRRGAVGAQAGGTVPTMPPQGADARLTAAAGANGHGKPGDVAAQETESPPPPPPASTPTQTPPPTLAADPSAVGEGQGEEGPISAEQLQQFRAQVQAAERLAAGRPLEIHIVRSVRHPTSRAGDAAGAAGRPTLAPASRGQEAGRAGAAEGPSPRLGRALQPRSAPERACWSGDGGASPGGRGTSSSPLDMRGREGAEESDSVEHRRSQRRGRGGVTVALAATQRVEALDAKVTGTAIGAENGTVRASPGSGGAGGGGGDAPRVLVPNPNRLAIGAEGVAVLSPDPRTMGSPRLFRVGADGEAGAGPRDSAEGAQGAAWRVPLPARGELSKYPAASVRRGSAGHLVWTFLDESSAGLHLALCKPVVAWSEVGKGVAEVAHSTAAAAPRVGRVTMAWLTGGRFNADKTDLTLAVRPSTLRRPQLLVPRDAASEDALYASLAVQRALVALERGMGKPGEAEAGAGGGDEPSPHQAPLSALRRLLGRGAQVDPTWSLQHALRAHALEGEERVAERAGWARELAGERPAGGHRPRRWGHSFVRSWSRHGPFLLQMAARGGKQDSLGSAVEHVSTVNPAGCVRALPRTYRPGHKVPARFRTSEDTKRWLMSVGIVPSGGGAGRGGNTGSASAGARRKTTRRHAGEQPAAKRLRTQAGRGGGAGAAEAQRGYLDPPPRIVLPWLELRRSAIHNLGLFATRDIEPNCVLTEYVGEIVRPEVADVRERRYQARGVQDYMFRMAHSRIVDATMRGNRGRYINHSCEPNSYAVVHASKHVCIYSARRIKAGEEITYDYQFAPAEESIPCFCGAPTCRGTLNFRDGLD